MRIASLQPSITLTLQALGRLDCLCAVTKYCVGALPELAESALSVLPDSWSFEKPEALEALAAAKPDVVIASVPYRNESLTALLKAGFPVLALAPQRLADIYADIRLIAALAAVDSKPVTAKMQAGIAAVRERSKQAGKSRPLVYCEEWGKPLIHSQKWVAELVDAAGGVFLGTPGARTTAEPVAAADPDVLLFAWCGAGDRVPLERVVEQRNWRGLRAVREGRVYCIPDEYLNTPAPTLLQGLACIASAVHPEIHPPHPRLTSLEPETVERN